jgi:hypothetical protein
MALGIFRLARALLSLGPAEPSARAKLALAKAGADPKSGVRSRADQSTHRGRFCPPYEPVNLSYFTVPDVNEIKDLRLSKTPKVEKTHIL